MKGNKNSGAKSVFRRAMESRGFYIALFSLVAILGATLYLGRINASRRNNVSFDDEAWQKAVEESQLTLTQDEPKAEGGQKADGAEGGSETAPNGGGAEGAEGAEPKRAAKGAEKPSGGTEKQTDSGSGEAAKSGGSGESGGSGGKSGSGEAEAVETSARTAADGVTWQLPCSGKIIAACSLSDLVYSATMNDWRTHNGIDIAAKVGDPVKAAADGTVSKVYEDELLGIVVEIDHGNGVSSVYANLQSYDFIRTGTKVKAGDIVGGVGKAGALEKDSEAHLHFEVHKNGEFINPAEFIGA